jgi:NAD(P)-dependent dehydrogenase (short-subunit alcohol dehydrogenase family)
LPHETKGAHGIRSKLFADDRGVIAAARDSRRVAPSGGDGRKEVFGLDLAEAATIVETARDVERTGADDDLAVPVNVAGIILEGSLKTIPPTNCVASSRSVSAAAVETAGKEIVNIGAVSTYLRPSFCGPLAAPKATVTGLSDAMRMKIAPFGIRSALIQPRAIQTGIFSVVKKKREAMLAARCNWRCVIARR